MILTAASNSTLAFDLTFSILTSKFISQGGCRIYNTANIEIIKELYSARFCIFRDMRLRDLYSFWICVARHFALKLWQPFTTSRSCKIDPPKNAKLVTPLSSSRYNLHVSSQPARVPYETGGCSYGGRLRW